MAYENGHVYWICPVGNTGVALSVRGSSQVSQNRDVFLYTREPIADQLWRVDVGNGFARIKSTLNESYALNIYLSTGNCDIHTWADNLEDSKINFRTIDAGNNVYRIQNYRNNADNDLYLTASSTASGGLVTWNSLNSGSSRQQWKLIEYNAGSGEGGHTISMPVNVNQFYSGNSAGIRNAGCALCCGVDIASFKHNRIYTLADFRGYYNEGIDSNNAPYVSYDSWAGPNGFRFKDAESLAGINEAQTIDVIRNYVNRGIPVACHATGYNGKQHWFVAYSTTANGGSTWATCGITVLDPYNGNSSSYDGRRVSIWDAMQTSHVTLGIDRIRVPA